MNFINTLILSNNFITMVAGAAVADVRDILPEQAAVRIRGQEAQDPLLHQLASRGGHQAVHSGLPDQAGAAHHEVPVAAEGILC